MRTAVGLLLLISLCRSAEAAENGDPTGTWTFSLKANNQTRKFTLKLKVEGEKLMGTLTGRETTPIEEGTFKNGKVRFLITRERNGEKITLTYSAKLDGDVLKGTLETERAGKVQKIDWEAKREKQET